MSSGPPSGVALLVYGPPPRGFLPYDRGSMFIDRAGIPFILIALALAAAAAWGGGRAWSVPFLVLAAFFVFFFRDPDRTTPTDPNLIVSPADGRVMIAGDQPATGAP